MVLLQLVVFRHRWLFIPSCLVSGALTTGQGHCGASLSSLCSQWGRANLWDEGLGISSGWISWAGGKNCYAAAGLFIYKHVCSGEEQRIRLQNQTAKSVKLWLTSAVKTFLSRHSNFHVILCDQWPVEKKMASTYINTTVSMLLQRIED